jgi:hypothetical protein
LYVDPEHRGPEHLRAGAGSHDKDGPRSPAPKHYLAAAKPTTHIQKQQLRSSLSLEVEQ